MKNLKYLGVPLVLLMYLTLAIPFQSCETSDDECDSMVVYKPNIYIHPIKNIDLNVKLKFPKGGKIITSIPKYNNAWNVSVDPNGLINNQYNYLFYESSQPNIWQREKGWLIAKNNLASFFKENMKEYGFNKNEIKDFIDYWIPRLKDDNFYIIYPQTKEIIKKVIELNLSKQPDNLLRLFYVIKGRKHSKIELEKPVIAPFSKEGYYITEWGVILD